MSSLNVADLVPRDKLDLERASKAAQVGYPAVAPIIPSLLEWLQDINWPVAQKLQPMLASIGMPIADDLRAILRGPDLVWSQWILQCVVCYSADLIGALRPEIEALTSPAANDPEASDTAQAAQTLLRLQDI